MCGNGQLGILAYLVERVLLHAEGLPQGIVDFTHFAGTEAQLMDFENAVSVFVARHVAGVVLSVIADGIVIGDADVVEAETAVNTVQHLIAVVASISHTARGAGVGMEVAFQPGGGVHALVRVVQIVAMERVGLVEVIDRDENAYPDQPSEKNADETEDKFANEFQDTHEIPFITSQSAKIQKIISK